MLKLSRLFFVCFGFFLALCLHANWSVAQETPTSLLPLPSGAQPVPEALVDCVPELKEYPDRYIFLSANATVKDKVINYYTIGVNRLDREREGSEGDARTPPEKKRYWETTVAVDEKGDCKVLVARNQFFKTLQDFMPKAIARQLALQRVQQYVEADKGIEKLQIALNDLSDAQTFLNRNRSTGFPYSSATYAPEYIWALQQVGVKVPDNIPVYPEPKEEPEEPNTDSSMPSGATP